MAINQNDKVIRKINVNNINNEISAKYLNDHTYDEIEQDIRDSCDEIRNNLLSPIYYYSNPKLDIKDETNNVYCYGYVGLLKNINVYGDYILIDSISVYVRENENIENLDTPVWCRLLKFVNNTWETVYQSTESKTIRGIAPETLFSFKMRAIDDTNDTNKLIRSTDKIAIVYVDSEDAQVLSGVRLGFKAILNTGGGLQNPLANNSGGNPSWCPAFTIGYLTDNPTNPGETFEGSIKINNGDININNKTTISSEIDSGELKVRHHGTTKGFIIRTNNKDENANSDIFPLEILTTNNEYSYQYNFPKSNGDVLLYKKVTYSELVGLKNNSQLVPGGIYRISDYETYTAAGFTSSAGNLFDILVVAISKNELSENANACLHDGDTYFSTNGAKLESWKIKYCIDNDDTRFQWINGTDTIRKGVIYYMKDEWGNEAPYDFKNILFNKNGVNYYTFSFSNNGSIEDATVTTKNVYNNKILPYYDLGDKNMVLNHNTFLLINNQHLCVSNYIGQNCRKNTFGSYCMCNTLESYCNNNTFGDNCMCNTLESYSEYNTFGTNCQYNEFDEYCTDNTFGDYCQSNVFGVSCTYNKFGSYILRCNIGDKCSYCKITNNDGDNGALLSNVKMIEFGDECSNVNLWTDNTDSGYVQNYKITNGLSGSIKITGDNIRGRNYQTIITKNVYGDIEQFVLSAGGVIKNILYSDLKDLRDNNKLIPGCKYRITNFLTTTNGNEGTSSAKHQFDIIVEALTTNSLSEIASACLHEGDEYFSTNSSKPQSWELKYSLDNDNSRFMWAQTNGTGTGVIYYMKDEWGNEAPYDFKNIKYGNFYTFDYEVGGTHYDGSVKYGKFCYSNKITCDITDGNGNKYGMPQIVMKNNGANMLCYNNIFKSNIWKITLGSSCYNNTFGDKCEKITLNSNSYNNIFGEGCHDINFSNGNCRNNSFGNNCYNITFGSGCYNNIFGNDCHDNTFGSDSRNNNFGNNCYKITTGDSKFDFNAFGNGCHDITFGSFCYYNTFGNYCSNNTFGDSCDNNSFGNSCDNNSFGNECSYNTFGTNCNHNILGTNCTNNSIGNSSDYNTFGNECNNNTFGNYCYYNSFGNECRYNTFGNSCNTNGFYGISSYVYNEEFDRYIGDGEYILSNVQYVVLGEGCQYLLFHTSDNNVKNITVTNGVKSHNTNSDDYRLPLPIEIPVTNNEYELKIACNSSGNIKIYCEADLID